MRQRQRVLLLVGMALFAGAAISAMAFLPGPMRIPRSAKVILPLAALGLSAAIPFAAVYLQDWRVKRGPLLWRGVCLGLTVVLCAHAIFGLVRSEEQTSELQSLMRISYAVFCLKK